MIKPISSFNAEPYFLNKHYPAYRRDPPLQTPTNLPRFSVVDTVELSKEAQALLCQVCTH